MSKYDIILDVFRTGSISKTAQSKNYSQPAVSQIISSFEKEIGFSVFKREKNGLFPTRQGALLFDSILKITQEENKIQKIVQSCASTDRGTIKIGTFESISTNWLPTILEMFSIDHPSVNYELVHGTYDTIQKDIALDRIDCGFTTSLLSEKNLTFCPLLDDEFMVVLPRGHELSKKAAILAQDLADYPMVISAEGLNYDIGNILDNSHIRPNIRILRGEDMSSVLFVEKGLGIGIFPQLILNGLKKDISCRPFVEHYSRIIGIATQDSPYISPLTRDFIKTVHKYIQERYGKTYVLEDDRQSF